MRFDFKTGYRQDVRMFRHRSDVIGNGALLLCMLAAPLILPEYFVGELTFLLVYGIACVGLMLLSGFTGLISLGHAAFMGIGAYAHSILLEAGLPFIVTLPIAGLITGAIGMLLGIPALRMTGLYLAIATLAFSIIVEHVIGKWEGLTHGHGGMQVPDATLLGLDIGDITDFYYVALVILCLVILATTNLLRSATGRSMIALRDSEVAAQALGVNLAYTKVVAFALSAAITGMAGGLFAHRIGWLEPGSFNVILSLQLLMMVVVGGLGSIKGALLGVAFLGVLDPAIAILKDYLPAAVAGTAGFQLFIFGLVLVFFVLFEPRGLYGRWLKVKAWFDHFPMYRRATFQRTKTYMKSER
jgi:branched-chain amino acid transport system permease protein